MQCNFVIKGLVSLFVVLFGSLVGTVDWIDNILVEKIKILISVAQLTVLSCTRVHVWKCHRTQTS